MDVDIVPEVITASYHLASLGQFYVDRSANLASHCFIEIYTLPGFHQEIFGPLHIESLGVSHCVNEPRKLSCMLTLKTLYRC
jgi:hypothetical protein